MQEEILSIFNYLESDDYFNFYTVNKRYSNILSKNANLTKNDDTNLSLPVCNSLRFETKPNISTLPLKVNELYYANVFPSASVIKSIEKFQLRKLVLNHVDCNTMQEYKQLHQTIGKQVKLEELTYPSPPTDPSLLQLTNLVLLTKLNVRLIPRIIPVVTKLQNLKSLDINIGSQSIVKITEDNNGTNPFKSFSGLLNLTSLRVSADSIKQLNSLSELTSIKGLKVLDLMNLNVSQCQKLTFVTKLRNLQHVYIKVKPLTTPDEVATYLKMPKQFTIYFEAFNHDFEKSKSFDNLLKLKDSKNKCNGFMKEVSFFRNTCQLDEPLKIINSYCHGFGSMSFTSCPNISNQFLDAADVSLLTTFKMNQCLKIKSFAFLKKCPVLSNLSITKCSTLQALDDLKELKGLTSIELGNMKIKDLKFIGSTKLKQLILNDLPELENVDVDAPVRVVSISNCTKVAIVDFSKKNLSQLSLKDIEAENCLAFVSMFNSLTTLTLDGIKNATFNSSELFGITGATTLKSLTIRNMPTFTEEVNKSIISALPNIKINLI